MNNEQKSKKQNNVFVTLLVILMTVAVVVAIAGAVAKNLTSPEKAAEETTGKKTSDTAALREDRVHDAEEEVTLVPEDSEKVNEKEQEAKAAKETEPETAAKDAFVEESLPQFTCPASGTLQKEHSVDVPVFSITMEDYRTHNGVDICAAAGSDVVAAADGTVKEIWSDPMMGNCISLSHAGNAVTTYKNIGEQLPDGIEKGISVHAGDLIATVGDTALEEIAEESHLHFEMTVDGAPVNPKDYISFTGEQDFTE